MRRLLAALVLVVTAPPTLAWTPQTRIKMVEDAIRLMPESLSLALESHHDNVRRGAVAPMADEDDPAHHPPWSGGTLDAEIATRAESLVVEISEMKSFKAVAERLGELAHFIADAEFPPGASGSDGAGRYPHFSDFCASRREKFPVVFYGHENGALASGDYRAFALAILERSKLNDDELARAYAAAGDPPDPSHFDDRSVPFAVGSLSYSHAVTDIVRAWLAVWERAGGDVGRTPYLDPNAPRSDPPPPSGDRRP
jgi:hypothetical protein